MTLLSIEKEAEYEREVIFVSFQLGGVYFKFFMLRFHCADGVEAGASGGVAAILLARQVILTIRKKKVDLDQDEDEVDYNFLTVAAKEAEVAMQKEEGGPFGAVIVRNGEIVAQAHNEVLKQKDPTAHAEIVAIQKVRRMQSILENRRRRFLPDTLYLFISGIPCLLSAVQCTLFALLKACYTLLVFNFYL